MPLDRVSAQKAACRGVAQLVRASVSKTEGPRFDPSPLPAAAQGARPPRARPAGGSAQRPVQRHGIHSHDGPPAAEQKHQRTSDVTRLPPTAPAALHRSFLPPSLNRVTAPPHPTSRGEPTAEGPVGATCPAMADTRTRRKRPGGIQLLQPHPHLRQSGAGRDRQGHLADTRGNRPTGIMVGILTMFLGVFFFGGGSGVQPGRQLPAQPCRLNLGRLRESIHGSLVHHSRLFGLREQGPRFDHRRGDPHGPRPAGRERSRCRPRRSPRSRRGKKVQSERKFFPGYVLAKLEMNDDVYHLVKNTPKVTGFLGASGKPQPITEAEAARILNTKEEAAAAPKTQIKVDYEIGDRSRCSTARSPASTAWSRSSISTSRRSRSRCRSSAARRRWSSTSSKSSEASD